MQIVHCRADIVGDFDGVGAGSLQYGNRHGGFAVEQRAQRIVGSAEFDAGDVAKTGDLAVRAALDDDVAEFLRSRQTALGIDVELQVDAIGAWRCADNAGCGLDVLLTDGVGYVAGGEIVFGHLLRIQPDAHGIVTRAEDLHLTHAFDTGQAILDVQRRIVAQIGDVIGIGLRHEIDDHDEVGRAFDGGDAECAHFRGQARFGLRHAVLHQLLRLVRVGAQLERDGQRQHAVRCRLAAHIEHVLDAVDLFFKRRGDGFGDNGRVRTGIGGADDDGWRHDFRIFGNRQGAHAEKARDHDQDRQHAGEDRPVDKKSGNIHIQSPLRVDLEMQGPFRRHHGRR